MVHEQIEVQVSMTEGPCWFRHGIYHAIAQMLALFPPFQ
jgi:hypothetical protein